MTTLPTRFDPNFKYKFKNNYNITEHGRKYTIYCNSNISNEVDYLIPYVRYGEPKIPTFKPIFVESFHEIVKCEAFEASTYFTQHYYEDNYVTSKNDQPSHVNIRMVGKDLKCETLSYYQMGKPTFSTFGNRIPTRIQLENDLRIEVFCEQIDKNSSHYINKYGPSEMIYVNDEISQCHWTTMKNNECYQVTDEVNDYILASGFKSYKEMTKEDFDNMWFTINLGIK